MRTEEKTEQQKKKIIQRIEKNLEKKVEKFMLAEICGKTDTVNNLGIFPKSGMGTAWGLILFCREEESQKQSVYFYYPATEGMFDFFFRQNSGDGPLEDQFTCLNDFAPLSFNVPKKTFFSFLNPEEKHTVFVTAKKGGQNLYFSFSLMTETNTQAVKELEAALG